VDIATRVFHGTVAFFMVADQKSNPYFMCRTYIEISGSNANYKDNSLTDGTVAYLIIF
jgi:hypothetical protein